MKKFLSLLALIVISSVFASARLISLPTASNKSFIVEYMVDISHLEKETQDLMIKNYLIEVASGQRTAYEFNDSTKTISFDEIERRCVKTDTFYIENPEPPYNLEMRVTRISANPINDLSGIWYKELWTIDQKGAITKKPVAVAPMIFNYGMCWIKIG